MALTRTLTIVAQDPALRVNGRIVTARVAVPHEALEDGPRGYRVVVLDYDSSTDTLYQPLPKANYERRETDPFAGLSDQDILNNPRFHAQNVYAIVMRTLARFEFALGRRVGWSFGGHQLFVAPHAFADANAFYSNDARALMFGYFPSPKSGKPVFSCLSHDVIVHETTHALLDGLRERYQDPSSPDQAAFHEGFADVIAMLSAFSIPEVMDAALRSKISGSVVERETLTIESLRTSVLSGLAEQMGQELSGVRGQPLRRSAGLPPSAEYLSLPEFEEPHRRGEVFVAAMMDAFLRVLATAFESLGDRTPDGTASNGPLDKQRVIQEAAETANRLLNICIRAVDYTPPVHLIFGDFLSAMLTSDQEMVEDDSRYGFRKSLRESFDAYGIPRAAGTPGDNGGFWSAIPSNAPLDYSHVHFESMRSDHDEVFRFIWENRKPLGINPEAYTEVISVRPCHRIGPDGFILHETVAEYRQILTLKLSELEEMGISLPEGLQAASEAEPHDEDDETAEEPEAQSMSLYGGGTLIFSEFGRLKYHIFNSVANVRSQEKRIHDLYRFGHFEKGSGLRRKFASMHLSRMSGWPLGLPAIEEA